MQSALETLTGTPCYHGFVPLNKISHIGPWTRAFEAKYHFNGRPFTRQDWDNLLGDYGAVTDVPTICFADELIAAYPEAKVVLVERDIESWYRSFESYIDGYYQPINRVLTALDPQFIRPCARLMAYILGDRKGFFRAGSKKELQYNARLVYREHYAHVRAITPKERLLEFELKEGWGPLCEFLGKKVPDARFPRLHEGDALKKWVVGVQRKGMLNVVRNLMVGVLSIVIGWVAVVWALRRRS